MDSTNDSSFFHFNQLKIFLHPEVYEPAEDTFLMLETIKIKPNQDVLEIGAGTGIISLYCAKKGTHVVCTDINPYAIQLIQRNIQENKEKLPGTIEVRKGDLFNIINKDERFDVIIFNPPYLSTTIENKKNISPWYTRSFDGGQTGLRETKRFLKQLNQYLKKKTIAYFISSSFSNSKELQYILAESSFNQIIINQLRCDDEILSVHQLSI